MALALYLFLLPGSTADGLWADEDEQVSDYLNDNDHPRLLSINNRGGIGGKPFEVVGKAAAPLLHVCAAHMELRRIKVLSSSSF